MAAMTATAAHTGIIRFEQRGSKGLWADVGLETARAGRPIVMGLLQVEIRGKDMHGSWPSRPAVR